jgi:hypothetical protein
MSEANGTTTATTAPTQGTTATGSNPAGGAGSVTPPSGTSGTPSDWTTGLNEDLKGYVQNKGFKDVSAVLESYKHSESLIGKLTGSSKERLIGLPEKDDDPKWGEIYDKMGRPAKPSEYQMDAPKEGNKEFTDWAKNTFHELGLTRKQAETLYAKYGEFAQGTVAKTQEQQAEVTKEAERSLKKEWGMAYEQNVALTDRAINKLGLEEKTLLSLRQVMGPADAMKFVHGLAVKLGGEAEFVSGDTRNTNFGNVLTPEAAQNRISMLRSDPDFVRRYSAGEGKAKSEMDNLFKQAYPNQ